MSSLWSPPPLPPTKLGRYRTLSPLAGVRVSPLQLGAMSIGDKWEGMGSMDKTTSFKLLDAYFEAGVSRSPLHAFSMYAVPTRSLTGRGISSIQQTISELSLVCGVTNDLIYSQYSQDESSETFIGEWVQDRDIRDQLVIATKYTTNYKRGQKTDHMVNYSGNSAKSLHVSVEASLRKLRTTYIDLLYVHWWDYTTSVEEVMNSLHVLVQQGKVLYLVRSLLVYRLR
jgi:aryl-alcohol dehydrogenase-like predicted oxidoreductase